MSSTNFVDGVTPIVSTWLNDVNTSVYTTVPNQQTQITSLQTKSQGAVTAASGQSIFTVPFTYVVGSHRLQVYISGIHQLIGSSYTETSTTSITFSEAVPVNCVVEFVGT